MLSFGKNITQKNDPLEKIEVGRLYKIIRQPPENIKSDIEQLRMILNIDKTKYRVLKVKLPYVCCGLFNPPFRTTENFGSISHFIVDIDHIKEKGLEIESLKNKLQNDPRIELIFISPGKDGLKVLFNLNEKCYDHSRFSMFYKIFVNSFSSKYNLEQVVDYRNSDVTRACFVSWDDEAYFNPFYENVSVSSFINFEDESQVNEVKEIIKEVEKQNKPEPAPRREISPDILREIKMKLNPNLRLKAEKQIFVPEELNSIIDKVKEKVSDFDIETVEITNIHYGKKFNFKLNEMIAEVNVFYGKKGYSVVKSPKRGTNSEFNEIVYKILCELFFN